MILVYDAVIQAGIRQAKRIRTLVYGVDSKEVALVMRLQNSPHYNICGFIVFGKKLKSYEIAERPVYYFETPENIDYVVKKFGIGAILFANYANAKLEDDRLIKYCTAHKVKVLIAPPIDEIVDGKLTQSGGIRDIKIEDLLGREAEEAFDDRKNLARKLGEEAGTKLMIPMFLMLIVVFAIVIVPAFFSIQV